MDLEKGLLDLRANIPEEQILLNESMKKHTSFRIGGPADIMVVPHDTEQVKTAIEIFKAHNIPYFIMGRGSNLLVRDKGIRGGVIKLADGFSKAKVTDRQIQAQAGILLSSLSNLALRAELTGLEFASGIPGTLGGAVAMNAGAYGGEIKDVIEKVIVLDENQKVLSFTNSEMNFGYRKSIVQNTKMIVLEVYMTLEKGNYQESKEKIKELTKRRREKQPLNYPSAGSTFKRPVGYYAGKLIQDSGLKGMRVGNAQISELHSGFIINMGDATAEDVIKLIEKVKTRVYDRFGVNLEPELKIIGEE
ncbi:MAG: UDP-N-acetylmuramate dehydrogenase [Caldicoprobacterales bacterium]|nr:UDP-N-acetylmuramate dehydrogenase [Clostridia bacterium]MDI9512475.1 UDP-N-acetylmuramate dehydrogenase [Bacillota bacterium]NLH58152.1 UDP-N-acetylmuramate dehydrogenase [Clostridiales bacterium]